MQSAKRINLHNLTMGVSSTDAQGVVGVGTRLHFLQKGQRVIARYSGGAVVRGFLAGRATAAGLTFRYLQVESSGEMHGGSSVCEVFRKADGRVRIVEHFAWRTRPGTGINLFDEIPS